MSAFRYGIAVLMLIAVPPAILLWYAIHPFARFWRRFGALGTYAILLLPVTAVVYVAWAARRWLLAVDLGTQPWLAALGFAAGVAGAAIALRRRKQLTQRVLMGVPELSSTDRGTLLTEGIYARVRNPRYIEFLAFLLGYVAVANYVGTWVLFLAVVPATHVLVLLEERELRDRFGAEYEEYCRQVPRWIPGRSRRAAARS